MLTKKQQQQTSRTDAYNELTPETPSLNANEITLFFFFVNELLPGKEKCIRASQLTHITYKHLINQNPALNTMYIQVETFLRYVTH